MRKIYLIVLFVTFFLGKMYAQSTYKLDTLIISTGYNRSDGAVSNVGTIDAFWTVVSDPNINTNEPRPAYVVNKNSMWISPFPNTQWISAYSTTTSNLNGLYEFDFVFYIKDVDSASMYLSLYADDSAQVFLNNQFILSARYDATNKDKFHSVIITDPSKFLIGKNTIRVNLLNIFSFGMGFNLYGFLKAKMANDIEGMYYNCNPTISGIKWNDLNGNGIKDGEEPFMQGWEIVLADSLGKKLMTDTTDENGFYGFFPGAGTYIISEKSQPNWKQTYPGCYSARVEENLRSDLNGCDSTYLVKINCGDAIGNVNFGNKMVNVLPSLSCENCIGSFRPEQDSTYIVSVWVKEDNALPKKTNYDSPHVMIEFLLVGGSTFKVVPFAAVGAIIDGWQRIEGQFTVPANATDINVKLECTSGTCFFDDIRIFPYNGTMKTFVYDPINLNHVADLDERNYATIYEYNEEGKRIRIKKETEKGIMTIQESKTSLKKKK